MFLSHEKMELDIGLNGPLDMLLKAEREKERLYMVSQTFERAVFTDHLFNFAVTIHHLGDWVVKNDSNPISIDKVQQLIQSENVLQACKDIGNSIKHVKIDRKCPTTQKVQTSVEGVSGILRPGDTIRVFNHEQSNDSDELKEYDYNNVNLNITMSDGEVLGLQEFCNKAISVWKEFLGRNGYST